MSKIPEIVSDIMARWGKKGGKSTTKQKAAAARENGQLGGRPKADKPTPAALAKRKSRARIAKENRK